MINILVVDDEEVTRLFAKKVLEKAHFRVTAVDCGNKALEILKKEVFSLVITDILMPEINGIKLTEKIHKMNPQIPIIACSSGGSTGGMVTDMLLTKAEDFGAILTLKKPFSAEELVIATRKIIYNPSKVA